MNKSRLNILEHALAVSDGTRRIDALNDLAEALEGVDAQRRLALTTEARRLASQAGREAWQARSALNRGAALSDLGQFAEGASEVRAALETARAQKQDRLVARSLMQLGDTLTNTGEVAGARDVLLEALASFEALGDTPGEADCLNALGVLADMAGDYAEAFEHHRRALSLRRAAGESANVAGSLGNLGHVWAAMGDHVRALEYHDQALDLFNQRGEPHNVARALLNVALGNDCLERPEVALGLYERALPTLQAHGDEVGAALAQANLSSLRTRLGAPALAVTLAQAALTTLERHGALPLTSVALLGLGEAHAAQGDLDAARTAMEQAVERGQACGLVEMTIQAHESLSGVLLQLGDAPGAYDHLRRCLDQERERARRQVAQRTRALLIELEADTAKREAQAAQQRARELQHLNEVLEAAQTENLGLLRRLERQANQDALTGLYNRRYFNQQFELEQRRALEHGLPLSVALFDIDHFKRINDTFSHLTGDRVLERVAGVLRTHCAGTDTLARYGGEEFVLLMPHTPLEDAQRRCERMLRAVEAQRWSELAPGERVTLSAGVADSACASPAGGLLEQADLKLYEAKQAGRNQLRR